MDDTRNPFAVVDAPLPPALPDDAPPPPFYTVGPWKIVVLMVFTFGFYRLYWFYRQFLARKPYDGNRVPLVRAIVHVFFTHRLFADIAQWKPDDEPEAMFDISSSNGGLATSYVGSAVLDSAASRYDGYAPWVHFLIPLMLALQTGVLVNVQRQIQAHLVPRGVPANTEATPGFLLASGIFGSLWVAWFAYVAWRISNA